MKPVDNLTRARDELVAMLQPGPDRRNQWQRYEAELNERLADGYPRTASGIDKPRGGPRVLVKDPDTGRDVSIEVTAVEAAVMARQRYVADYQEGCALAAEVAAGIARLAMLATTFNEPQPATRCSGGGSAAWADVTCEANAVTRDGLCDRCRRRRDYWRDKEQEATG
jgi:hypothetical protein